jgi:hypothetical protein
MQVIAQFLPLVHATTLGRAAVVGTPAGNVILHVAVVLLYALVTVAIAAKLVERRLMR